MTSTAHTGSVSKKAMWIGWILSVLPALMLLFSGSMKLTKSPQVVEGFTHLGWPEKFALALAITEITCTILYLIPRTAVLGAILLTGYLGGAIATHARIEDPQFISPAVVAVVLWLGLFLREPRLRALIPLRR